MDTERIKVLYVDDEEGNLTAFRAAFRREFQVFTAISAAEGYTILEKEPMHVVVTDQRMPQVTGAEFLAEVKSRWPRTIRMMLTGYSDLSAVIDAINKGGIHAYITKPWDPVDLKLRIEQAYEVSSLRSERERLFERYRQVFDSSGDPIVIVDSAGKVHDANDAAVRLLGSDRTAVIGTPIAEHIDDIHRLVRMMSKQRAGSNFINVDLTLRTPRGQVLDCLMTATRLGRTPGGPTLYQAMIKDISDRKQEETRLKKLNSDLDKRVAVRTKQLMEALEDLGAFSYSVAHDLRSPLKSIRALTEHLSEMEAASKDPGGKELCTRITQNTARLIDLVDDLLRFAHTGSAELRKEEIDVAALVQESWEQLPKDAGRTIEFVIADPEHHRILADRSLLHVAFTNLLANAVKFSRGQEQSRIEVGARAEGSDTLFWVKDNGAGFDTAKQDQIFGVFKRLHRQDQFEGSGIGLAIVQRVVQKHGGSCWAESSVGQGATNYWLRLPSNLQDANQPAGQADIRMAS